MPLLSQEERAKAFEGLGPTYRKWVENVVGLITHYEFDYFLSLQEDFRRDAFMEAFWKPRDTDPTTQRNELKERWDEMRRSMGDLALTDPRAMLLLLQGPPGGWNLPDGRPVARCFSRQREMEIWFYGFGTTIDRKFPIIFQRISVEKGYEVYYQGNNLRPVQRSGSLPTTEVNALCADELIRYALYEIQLIGEYDKLVDQAVKPPIPSPEWLADFSGSDTEPPKGATLFDVDLDLAFPNRNQSRTAVQGMLTVSRDVAPGKVFGDQLFHHFLLIGEVIRDGRRLEAFRYRYEGPTPDDATAIPLGFQRFVRPGEAELRLLLQDIYTDHYAQVVQTITVPSPQGLPPVARTTSQRPSGPSLQLVPPSGAVLTGLMRFRARAYGTFDKVAFFVDDRQVLSKRKPPYSVELDLGPDGDPRRVRVVGFVDDREVATDQIWINQGALRFRVGLIEPRAGGIYPGGVVARAVVETPDGAPPERLELYLGDALAATLTEPPYAHALQLPAGEPAVVRAVAHLADGTRAEDTVIVNASPFSETVDVRLVEVPVLVLDGAGRPIRDLGRERFQLFSGDTPQTLEGFAPAAESPLRAALVIDRSASMAPHLIQVGEAAAAFGRSVAADGHDGDRVGFFSFADRLTLDAAFGADAPTRERALAGLAAGGQTALYDSLVQTLRSFDDGPGPSAVVLFTDGLDEGSELTLDETLDILRQGDTVVYAIGLGSSFPEPTDRETLEALAASTGGRARFLENLDGLDAVYQGVLEELRARYVLTFQPPADLEGPQSLTVEVDTDESSTEVLHRPSYRP